MQNTSNYNLNLVEGTDLVNPPIQFNPNFQTIDAAMFANKEKTVGTASEVVTGTVHAIVRANQDADVFRFTATGNWVSGDTMTVDGSAVTVHLSDGTAPLDGAYVIGAEVVAVLNGTLVTLLTSSKAIDPGVTSFNSRSGAVTPAASDYDASMIDYDNTLSSLTSTDVQSAIDELASGGASGGLDDIWTNPNPTSDVIAGTLGSVTLNKTYSAFVIVYRTYKGLDIFKVTGCAPNGSAQLENFTINGSGQVASNTRTIALTISLNVLTISAIACSRRFVPTYGTAQDSTTNDYLIPYKVYGIPA